MSESKSSKTTKTKITTMNQKSASETSLPELAIDDYKNENAESIQKATAVIPDTTNSFPQQQTLEQTPEKQMPEKQASQEQKQVQASQEQKQAQASQEQTQQQIQAPDDWQMKRYFCASCKSWMFFCSHCRICGEAICRSCVRSSDAPDCWLTCDYIPLYDQIPQHVKTMKCCLECFDKCIAIETCVLQMKILLPALMSEKLQSQYWYKFRDTCDKKFDKQPERMRQLMDQIIKRHQELKENMRYASLTSNEVSSNVLKTEYNDAIVEADPDIIIWDIMYRTPKYEKQKHNVQIMLSPELYATFLQYEASSKALASFLTQQAKLVTALFPVVHFSNQTYIIQQMTKQQATILYQQNRIMSDLCPKSKFPLRRAHVQHTRDALKTLESYLCGKPTAQTSQTITDMMSRRKTQLIVNEKLHYIQNVELFSNENDKKSKGMMCLNVNGRYGTTCPRAHIVCTDKREYHVCFGPISTLYLQAATLLNESMFGRHYNKIYATGTPSYCIVFSDRAFVQNQQTWNALKKASVQSRKFNSLLLSLAQVIYKQYINFNSSRWTVDNHGSLIVYDFQLAAVPINNYVQTTETKTKAEEIKEEEIKEEKAIDFVHGETCAMKLNEYYNELVKSKSELLFWLFRILNGNTNFTMPQKIPDEQCIWL